METAVEIPAGRPETEVLTKAQRRRFTAEYKRRILKEADDAHTRVRSGPC